MVSIVLFFVYVGRDDVTELFLNMLGKSINTIALLVNEILIKCRMWFI